MPDPLAPLESDRSKLLQEFLALGDLRPGSITAVIRRCGKPSCRCAKPNDPGHDPQFRLTRRVAGKTETESFPNPAALRQARERGLTLSTVDALLATLAIEYRAALFTLDKDFERLTFTGLRLHGADQDRA